MAREGVEVEDGVVNLDVDDVVNRPDHEDDDLHDVEWVLDLEVAQKVVLLDVKVDAGIVVDVDCEVVVVMGAQDDEDAVIDSAKYR